MRIVAYALVAAISFTLCDAAFAAEVSYESDEFEVRNEKEFFSSWDSSVEQESVTVPKFNPALGTLTKVTVQVISAASSHGWSVLASNQSWDPAGSWGALHVDVKASWGTSVFYNYEEIEAPCNWNGLFWLAAWGASRSAYTTSPYNFGTDSRFVGTGTVTFIASNAEAVFLFVVDPYDLLLEGFWDSEFIGKVKVTYEYTP